MTIPSARHRLRAPATLPRFAALLAALGAASGVALGADAASAQDADRIWARVHTTSGEVHEGFIRWDRNEGSWVDILDGSKEVPSENYDAWLEANADGERPTRSLELKGYRITWNEEDPDFPSTATSGVRFGHLDALIVTGDDEAEIVLRSGVRVVLSGGSTDIGSMRELVVEDRDGNETELDWEDLDRVDFSAVPAGATAHARRLYGSVEDQDGNTYAGYLSWDLDEILESDILDGEDEEGDEHRIPFREIASIEGHRRGSTVTLVSGRVLELDDSNDVDRGNRGIQISDPGLGMVEVEWEEFRRADFGPAPTPGVGYDAFDGGHPLRGTVVTQAGEEISGLLRWDADEQWSWELLDGWLEEVDYTIEFGNITHIRRNEAVGVVVTLTDGRTLEVHDGNDVDWDNKGILVSPEGTSGPSEAPQFRYVHWDDFREVRFDHPTRGATFEGAR